MNLVIIGCGSIGFRHAEAAINSKIFKKLFLFDKDITSFDKFRKKFENEIELICVTKFSNLPKSADIVIVSSTANKRASLIESLIHCINCRDIIVEKPLGQSREDYDLYNKVLNIKPDIYVNCPRQLYPSYKLLKQKFKTVKDIKVIDIVGAKWGLGCNGTHFLVLCDYLFDGISIEDMSEENLHWYSSKREGFVECSGRINIAMSKNLNLNFIADNISFFSQRFKSDSDNFLVDEQLGVFENGKNIFSGRSPYLSEIMFDQYLLYFKKGIFELPKLSCVLRLECEYVRFLIQTFNRSHSTNVSAINIT